MAKIEIEIDDELGAHNIREMKYGAQRFVKLISTMIILNNMKGIDALYYMLSLFDSETVKMVKEHNEVIKHD